MKRLLMLDIKLLRFFPYIILTLFIAAILFKVFVGYDSATQVFVGYDNDMQVDKKEITFSFTDTFFILTMICVFFIHAQKYDTLRKHKIIQWYETLPVNKKDIRMENIILVLLSHAILLIFAFVFYAIHNELINIQAIILMFGISLTMNGFMLMIGIKNNLTYLLLVSIASVLFILAFGFHYLLIMNDINLNLNLSKRDFWRLYLYQFPYVVNAFGLGLCLLSFKVHRKV
ncbi:hypothetical protein [Macrococcus capreoli]|uniref:hypothetical protein n=1 Tax=Macrococcus capreoli TaxID=2982690 RepID=UPI0021D5DA09|nr:hypothetical protein [Macrococcus sp. TMW 2.2395]MCU7556490.1 hypothetical protein [Macrococcus sp. TMW 2.2395]